MRRKTRGADPSRDLAPVSIRSANFCECSLATRQTCFPEIQPELPLRRLCGCPGLRGWNPGDLPVKLGAGGVGEWLKPAVLKPKIAVWLSDTKSN
jgi:hypothetical protein